MWCFLPAKFYQDMTSPISVTLTCRDVTAIACTPHCVCSSGWVALCPRQWELCCLSSTCGHCSTLHSLGFLYLPALSQAWQEPHPSVLHSSQRFALCSVPQAAVDPHPLEMAGAGVVDVVRTCRQREQHWPPGGHHDTQPAMAGGSPQATTGSTNRPSY